MVKKEFEKYSGVERTAKIHGAMEELGEHLPERKKKLAALLKKDQPKSKDRSQMVKRKSPVKKK